MNDGNYFDDEPATASGGRRHYDDNDNDGYGFDDDDDFDEDFENIAVNTNNINQNKNIIQFDGLKTATTKAERRRKRRKYRNERTLFFVCIAFALGGYFLFFNIIIIIIFPIFLSAFSLISSFNSCSTFWYHLSSLIPTPQNTMDDTVFIDMNNSVFI